MEKRLFQGILALLSLIPLIGLTIAFGPGPAFFFPSAAGVASEVAPMVTVPVDLDSQWRYLSGVYVAVSLAIWWTLPAVDERLAPLRIVALGVMLGGVGRLISIAERGLPDADTMLWGLVLELGIVPLLLVWQQRLHRLRIAGAPTPHA